VFDAQPEEIMQLLNSPPPWGKEWQHGPIPMEIAGHCHFGTSGVVRVEQVIPTGQPYFRGDQRLVNLFRSPDVLFAANERGSATIRWHNGSLLAIDPINNRVWLSVWDY
jgi:hypothetical protein